MAKKRLESRIVKGESLKLYQRMDLQFADTSLLESLQKKNSQINLKESAGAQRKLIVTVEGIHTGMTKNLTFYPGPTLDESTGSWTTPHNKPVLKNHDELTEPLGRIVSAEYVESALVAGKDTVRMKLEITDAAAIDKILDGRYLTLSVGGSANKVTCSTCGKDLIQEGFCGHYRGKKYEGKTDVTHWMIGEYTGDEISFVNMPADVFAQVISMELVTAGEGGNNMTKKKGEATKTKQADPAKKKSAESTEENPLDLINNLTESENDDEDIDDGLEEGADGDDGDQQEDGSEEGEEVKEAKKDGDDDEGDDEDENEDEDEDAEKQGESVDDLKKKLEEQEAEVAALKTKLEESEASETAITAELDESKKEVERLEGELKESQENLSSAEEERDTFQRQNLSLARYSKRLLAERAVDLRIMQGKDKADDRETLIESYMTSSPKMLERTISDLFTTGQRFVARVTSPGYVPESNQEGESIDESFNKDANGTGKESTIKRRLTMAEFEREAVSSMSRQS